MTKNIIGIVLVVALIYYVYRYNQSSGYWF